MLISEREVEYLLDVYLTLLACTQGARLDRYREQIKANGGIILAIDGAKPEKGQPGLYIFRDALTGCRLHAALLSSADVDSLEREMRQVAALGLEVRAVISDDEAATQQAVAAVWPGLPHGLCHTHFLKAAQKPIQKADRHMAVELKKPLRSVSTVERILEGDLAATETLTESQRKAVWRYTDSLQAILLTKGQAPFKLAGVPIYEQLAQVTVSLEWSQARQDHPLLAGLQTMTTTHQAWAVTYQQIAGQQSWFLRLAEILAAERTLTHNWWTKTGAEVAQQVGDYLDELDLLRDGPYLIFDDAQDDPEELLAWFRQVDAQTFRDEKAKMDAMRQRLRNIRRFRQHPEAFLAKTERLWGDSG